MFSNSSHLEWRAGLSDTILKGTHPGTIPARFGLIWLSGFRGEDLNVIFYQNMPNLHNRYISAERKISQKNPEYMLNYSLPLNQIKPNLAGMVPGWVPFKIVSDSPALHSRWLLLLNIEISSNGQNCSILSQNVPKFELCKHNDELFSIYYRLFYEL
jgi:hypothetical protein